MIDDPPKGSTILPGKWVFDIKCDKEDYITEFMSLGEGHMESVLVVCDTLRADGDGLDGFESKTGDNILKSLCCTCPEPRRRSYGVRSRRL